MRKIAADVIGSGRLTGVVAAAVLAVGVAGVSHAQCPAGGSGTTGGTTSAAGAFGASAFGGPAMAGAFGGPGGFGGGVSTNALLQMQQMQAQQQQMAMQMAMAQQQAELAAQQAQLQATRQMTRTNSARSMIGPDELSSMSDTPHKSRREEALAKATERKAANAKRAQERQSRLQALRTKSKK